MKTMLRLAVGISALALSSGAFAADLIIEEPVEVLPVAGYDWSGFYAGVHGGWASGPVIVDPLDDPVSTASGWLLGVQAGGQTQMNGVVLGVEGDIAWTDISNEDDINGADIEGLVEVDWLGSLRGRAGLAFDQVLLYATAGIAGAGVTYTDTDLDPDETASGTHIGWTIGAGAEVAVADNISLKAEYAFYSIFEETYDLGDPDDVSFDLHTIKVGVNFHF